MTGHRPSIPLVTHTGGRGGRVGKGEIKERRKREVSGKKGVEVETEEKSREKEVEESEKGKLRKRERDGECITAKGAD
jgi:hypothetical protein